jgi:hypothetical protein
MQNREELMQKGHDGSKINNLSREGGKYHFQKGGGNKYNFGPKYRPLVCTVRAQCSYFTLVQMPWRHGSSCYATVSRRSQFNCSEDAETGFVRLL